MKKKTVPAHRAVIPAKSRERFNPCDDFLSTMSRAVPFIAIVSMLIIFCVLAGCTGIQNGGVTPVPTTSVSTQETATPATVLATGTPIQYKDAEFLLLYQASLPSVRELIRLMDQKVVKVQTKDVAQTSWNGLQQAAQELSNKTGEDSAKLSGYLYLESPANGKSRDSYVAYLDQVHSVAGDIGDGAGEAANKNYDQALKSFKSAQGNLNLITDVPNQNHQAVIEELKIHLRTAINVMTDRV
jgi:hypothetical protein